MYIYKVISLTILPNFLKNSFDLWRIYLWVELSISDYFRYLTCRGNVCCGMHLVREMSAGNFSRRESVLRGCDCLEECPSGICLVREVSVGHISGRRSVRWGCVWSGKYPSGVCLVREISVEGVSIGDVFGRGNERRGCAVKKWIKNSN